MICILPFSNGKGQTIDSSRIGIPQKPVTGIKLTGIDKYPSIFIRYQDFDMLRHNFENLPQNTVGKRNRIIRAWFSNNENEKEKATQEFIRYWKDYSKRWTEEKLNTERPDGVSLRGIWRTIQLYDIVESFGYLTEEDRKEYRDVLIRSVELALGNDPANLRTIPIENLGWRLSNIWTDVFLAAGWVGLAFPEIPQANQWVEFAVNELIWQTENGTWDGAWHECPRYHLYQMKITINFAIALYNRTGINLFENSSIKSQGEWCIHFSTPRDKVAGIAAKEKDGVVMSLGLGDSTWGENMGVLNILANYIQNIDTRLSQDLMWIWQRSGFKGTEEPVSDLLINTKLKASDKVNLKSAITASKGYIVMRDKHDTDDEVWFMLKCGKVSMCGHENGDANSFSLMAFGTPLALDAGSGDYGDPNHRAWNKRTISHNVVAFRSPGEDDPGKYDSSGWVDGEVLNWQTSDEIDYSATDASKANKVDKYVRHVVFVKPNYFVIKDEIISKKESSYLLHSPADTIIWNNNLISLYTPWHTQLDVHVLQPQQIPVPNEREGSIGAWTKNNPETRSWYKFKKQKYIELRANAGEDYITVLQPRKDGLAPVKTKLLEDGSIEVIVEGRKDNIKFTDDKVKITKGKKVFEYKYKKQ